MLQAAQIAIDVAYRVTAFLFDQMQVGSHLQQRKVAAICGEFGVVCGVGED